MSPDPVAGAITFRPLTLDDLPVLGGWLAEPLVARWWVHDPSPAAVAADFGPSVRGEEPGEDLLILLDGRPVGLMQRARFADYPEDSAELSLLTDVPDGAVELDYLIGEPEVRGHGVASRAIAAAVADTWTVHPDCPAIIIPVNHENVASWRALEKAGLRQVAEGDLTPDGPALGRWHVVHRIDRPDTDRPDTDRPDTAAD